MVFPHLHRCFSFLSWHRSLAIATLTHPLGSLSPAPSIPLDVELDVDGRIPRSPSPRMTVCVGARVGVWLRGGVRTSLSSHVPSTLPPVQAFEPHPPPPHPPLDRIAGTGQGTGHRGEGQLSTSAAGWRGRPPRSMSPRNRWRRETNRNETKFRYPRRRGRVVDPKPHVYHVPKRNMGRTPTTSSTGRGSSIPPIRSSTAEDHRPYVVLSRTIWIRSSATCGREPRGNEAAKLLPFVHFRHA